MMSMCRVISWVVKKWFLLWPACSLDKTLLAFSLLHFVLQGQICLLFQISLDFLLLHSYPLWWKERFSFHVISQRCLGVHRTSQLQLLWHQWLGHRLGLLWCWFALETNQDHSVIFEIGPKYCISDFFFFFFYYEGYSTSSKGFLPTVVDIMIILIKFIHSNPF